MKDSVEVMYVRSLIEIERLLLNLDQQIADELEEQDLDFKEWNTRSLSDALLLVVENAVCMANGGGGTVVFGVKDKVKGRDRAVLGVPLEIDVNHVRRHVYDSTDPKLTPVFEELSVPEGTGRLLVMHIYPGMPLYTDTAGRAKIRVGKDCLPYTGSLRTKSLEESGIGDFMATEVAGEMSGLISAAAVEQLREIARKEKTPEDLLGLSDMDLLTALGVIRNGRITRAGLLLAGKESAIQEHIPSYVWTYLKLQTDTHYADRIDGREALPIALSRITDRIMADNPIATVEYGFLHLEYRTYPTIALREALLNAFCHADYRISGPILVKQSSNKLEISNPGGFVGGISPENILHHQPISRNPHLVEALTKLRLVNRSNLGIRRMFSSLLVEGKEPPVIAEQGQAIKVTFLASELSLSFRTFVENEGRAGRLLTVDHLLILQHLLRHAEIDTATVAHLCQRPETEARHVLSTMERDFSYLDRGGTGKGTYWSLRPDLHRLISAPGSPERSWRTDWESAKTRILSILRQRAEKDEPGLTNQEIRQITRLDRGQVGRLMKELRQENPQIADPGVGRGARYSLRHRDKK